MPTHHDDSIWHMWAGGLHREGAAAGAFPAPTAGTGLARLTSVSVLATAALAALLGALFWHSGAEAPQLRYAAERSLPILAAALAGFASLFFLILLAVCVSQASTRRRRAWAQLALHATLVLGVSVVVRYGLTTPNLLSDGGSGWTRVAGDIPRYQAAPVVLRALRLGADADMPTSIEGVRALAALGPAFLLLLARTLGLGPSAALLAGLLLACWPVHAVLGSSDSLEGANLTIALAGLALVAAADRYASPAAGVTGLLVLGLAIWGRPESPLLGLPLLALLSFRPWNWVHPAAALAGAWLAFGALVHAIPVAGMTMPPFQPGVGMGNFPWRELMGEITILPFWAWAPLPLGLVLGPARRVVVGGLLAGLLPAWLFLPWHPSNAYTEAFRYGAVALPFAGLGSAIALGAVARVLAPATSSPARKIGSFLLVALPALATPWLSRDYLGHEYGPAHEMRAFRAAVGLVPPDCGLVVPDDEGGDLDEAGHIELLPFFRHVAAEARAAGASRLSPGAVLGSTPFLATVASQGWPPLFAAIPRDRYEGFGSPPRPTSGPACWYFFRGTYCATGMRGAPLRACDRLEEKWSREVVARWNFPFTSFRLVTRPSHRVPPWYDPASVVRLLRLGP